MPEPDVRAVAESLARDRRIERLVVQIAGRPLDADLEDLAQIVYMTVLTSDPRKIQALHDAGTLDFFLTRVIRNQYYSKSSPYYRKIVGFRNRTTNIDDVTKEQ